MAPDPVVAVTPALVGQPLDPPPLVLAPVLSIAPLPPAYSCVPIEFATSPPEAATAICTVLARPPKPKSAIAPSTDDDGAEFVPTLIHVCPAPGLPAAVLDCAAPPAKTSQNTDCPGEHAIEDEPA